MDIEIVIRNGQRHRRHRRPRARGRRRRAAATASSPSAGSPRQPGQTEIDAAGKIVAPGFIDVHTHDDRALLATPEMAAR